MTSSACLVAAARKCPQILHPSPHFQETRENGGALASGRAIPAPGVYRASNNDDLIWIENYELYGEYGVMSLV